MPNDKNREIYENLEAIQEEVARIHASVDRQRDILRQLLGPESDAVVRAEEAGTAVHRLKWALERLENPPKRLAATNQG